MAYLYVDNDRDSTFGDGDDDFLWTDPMYPLAAQLAGSKRDASNVIVTKAQPAPSALEVGSGANLEHIDPKVLTCRTCDDARCFAGASDSRPSKRCASALKVSEYHSTTDEQSSHHANLEHQFPDTCFEKFCQGCDWEPSCTGEPSCTSPCALPCADETECSQDDACWDPNCDSQCNPRCDPHCNQTSCVDECVDPECTKTFNTDDPCFCQNCDAQPCPLGDPNNDCHLAHSAPTTLGTIYCYDNAPCHFQEGYHGFNPALSGYETYPCYSQSHGLSDHRHGIAQASSIATPDLSNFTSLDSAFSNRPSPTPAPATAPSQGITAQCSLNIPAEHCHIDTTCCHGNSRACEDEVPFDLWNVSGNGLANSFMNYGLPPVYPATSLSIARSTTNAADLNCSLQNPIFGYDDPSWLLSDYHFSNMFQPAAPKGMKPEILTSTIPDRTLVTGLKSPNESVYAPNASGASNFKVEGETADDLSACVCRWQPSPGLLCLQTFSNAEELHKHIKTIHVDNCTGCFCHWEGCEASSKDFKQRSKLSRHLLGHAGYRPYSCSFEGCGKTFATNQAKDNHERTHTGDRPYVCDRCGYTTTTYTQLQTHISALHEGKKPHKCRFCDFSCADSSNLSKHERTHQTLRPYRCPHLNCTFKPDCRWENLKRHLRRSGHCPQLLVEGSEENKMYRDSVRREIDEWHKRNEDGSMAKISRRKGRGSS